MAPQDYIPPAASILGTIGTDAGVFRIISNWRYKQTDGLPWIMPFLWAAAAVPFGIYNIVQNFNIPLQVQPQVFCALTLGCWAQTLIYHEHWRVWTATLAAVIAGVVSGGIEALFVLTLRGPYARGVSWPITLIGVIAAVLLAVGLFPMLYEQKKRNGRAKDISFLFLTTDFTGSIFSLMALAVQQTFDYLGGTLYIICMVIEIGIMAWHISWVYRNRLVLRQARRSGMSYDEYVGANEKSPKSPADSSHAAQASNPRPQGDARGDVQSSPKQADKAQPITSEEQGEKQGEKQNTERDVERGL